MTGQSNLAAALAAFQAEMPTVAKKHTAQVKSDRGSYSYTYAGLADVTAAAMPLLAKHGLSFVTTPRRGEHGMELAGLLLHESGDRLEAALPIAGQTPQQIGSALTYMRRYLLGCMTGVVTDDDDDGQAAQQAKPKRQRKTPPPEDPGDRPRRTEGGASTAQIKLIGTLMSRLKLTDRGMALAYVRDVIGREVASRNELNSREASAVVDALQRDVDDMERQAGPPADPADPWAAGERTDDPAQDGAS